MTGKAFPDEFLLAAACCRWPLSEAALSAVRAAAGEAIDWPYLLRIVRRQRIDGLVHHALMQARIDVPPAVADELAARARGIARRNLRLADETARLQHEFDAAGIPVLVLKGASLALLAFGSLSLKHSRDIDLLVGRDHALAGMRFLEGAGYALRDPASDMSEAQRRAFLAHGKEVEFVHRAGRLRVELHWRLTDNPMLLRSVDASSRTRSVPLSDGASLRTLAEDDLFAYLCVHGAHHDWSRLKWLADVHALIATKSDEDLVSLYRHARARGTGYCAGQALLLCRHVLGLRLPPALDEELARSKRVRRLVAIALDAMVGGDGATETDLDLANLTHNAFKEFLLGQGWRFFLAQCRLACTGQADVIRFPLPPMLYFLYPVLRFPSWLWRHRCSPRRMPSA